MQKLIAILLLGLFVVPLSAQDRVNVPAHLFSGTPSGACATFEVAIDTTEGNLYSCASGTWQALTVGASGGVDLAFTNPTVTGGNSTYRPAMRLACSFDSSVVDPQFSNQDCIGNELTALNGQNQYGGGTNAKQSFFNEQNILTAYAAGQHFNIGNAIYAFGMGDVFSRSEAIRVMGGISANGDEGYGLLSSLFTHYPGLATATITSVTTPATISTTTTQSVTKSQNSQTVTVASSTGVSAGQWVVVDTADYSNIEAVKVTSVASGSITGVFRANHSNGVSVKPATVLVIDSPYGFGQGRPLINLSASAYTTGTATPTAGSTAIVGGGTMWANNMVGGDAQHPGYISFTEDDVDQTAYGSASTLKGWYPISSVTATTGALISRLDVLGQAGFPSNTHVSGSTAYTIRPGAQILMFDGDTSHLVLEYNPFTWSVGQSVECAFSVNNEWTGEFLRFTPLMPGRYDQGMQIRNSGEFSMDSGLVVDTTGNGSWTKGITISGAATGLSLDGNASTHLMEITSTSSGGHHPADIHWNLDGGYGVSLGQNQYLGDGQHTMVLSMHGADAGGGHNANENNAWTYNGALSFYYDTTSVMRWNGDFIFNSKFIADPSTNLTKVVIKGGSANVDGDDSTGRVLEIQNSSNTPKAWIRSDGTILASSVFASDATFSYGLWDTTVHATIINGLNFASTPLVAWSSDTHSYSAKDTGLGRNAAGVVEANTGILGTLGDFKARGLAAAGDNSGIASTTGFTNVTNTTLTNAYVVKGGQAATTANTGWIKIYIGTTVAWVPYWANATP